MCAHNARLYCPSLIAVVVLDSFQHTRCSLIGAILEINFEGETVKLGKGKTEKLPRELQKAGWKKGKVLSVDSSDKKFFIVKVLDVKSKRRRRGGNQATTEVEVRLRLRTVQEKTAGLERIVLANGNRSDAGRSRVFAVHVWSRGVIARTYYARRAARCDARE